MVFKKIGANVAIGFFSSFKILENTDFGHVIEVPTLEGTFFGKPQEVPNWSLSPSHAPQLLLYYKKYYNKNTIFKGFLANYSRLFFIYSPHV